MFSDTAANTEEQMNNITQVLHIACYSCRSCEQRCPKSCITMQENEEGFLYPAVDDKRCTDCGICVKHCPALGTVKDAGGEQKSYAAYLKDGRKLAESTSGGVFAGIAEQVIEAGGVVFGAAYDENLYVRQTAADTVEALGALKGSKYVESDTGDTFVKTKKLLEAGRTVFYTGTPCQIAGLKAYLGREYDNLVTADLICHGVPSRKLFKKYLEWLGKKTGGKIIYVGFRDKDVGGWSCGGKFKTKTKTKTKTMDGFTDPYYASFLRCETYRESCYQCPYSSMNRPGDITIGDFFEVTAFYPDIDRKNGVSLVILNTQKGVQAFEHVRERFELFTVLPKQYVPIKGNLSVPSPRPKLRDFVYQGLDTVSEKMFFHRFRESRWGYRVVIYSRQCASKVIPAPLKRLLKKIIKKGAEL